MVNSINLLATQKLLWTKYPASITEAMDKVITTGWLILAVEQSRGHCSYKDKEITIPVWAIAKGTEYTHWYLSHELSHVFTKGDGHGDAFMQMLLSICPPEAIHHEVSYKPKNALMNGIGCFDF